MPLVSKGFTKPVGSGGNVEDGLVLLLAAAVLFIAVDGLLPATDVAFVPLALPVGPDDEDADPDRLPDPGELADVPTGDDDSPREEPVLCCAKTPAARYPTNTAHMAVYICMTSVKPADQIGP